MIWIILHKHQTERDIFRNTVRQKKTEVCEETHGKGHVVKYAKNNLNVMQIHSLVVKCIWTKASVSVQSSYFQYRLSAWPQQKWLHIKSSSIEVRLNGRCTQSFRITFNMYLYGSNGILCLRTFACIERVQGTLPSEKAHLKAKKKRDVFFTGISGYHIS